MPLPFYVCLLTRQQDGLYVSHEDIYASKLAILVDFLRFFSKKTNALELLNNLQDGALDVHATLILLKEGGVCKLFYRNLVTKCKIDTPCEISFSEINRLLYEWLQLEKAFCEIITIAIVDSIIFISGFYKETYRQVAQKEKEIIFDKIESICCTTSILDNYQGEQIEAMLTNYLIKYPFDIEVWMRLAKLEFSMPWQDPYRILNYLENALMFDENNTKALLFAAYADYLHRAEIRNDLIDRLSALDVDSETASMIEYAKALSVQLNYDVSYENYLLSSISLCSKHVTHLKALGDYYKDKGEFFKALECNKKALQNIDTIFDKNMPRTSFDIFNMDEFFDYYYKGTYSSEFIINNLKEDIQDLEALLKSVKAH